jgi:integrase
MASLETRTHPTGTTYRVVWYEAGVKQRLTLGDPAEAVRFRKLVEGSGNRWPEGWQRPQRAAPPARTGKLTFGQWAETAITRRTRANERTKDDYRRDLERHFSGLLARPLDEIDDDDVVEWLEERAETVFKGRVMSGKTIRNLYGFASSLYVDALAQHPPLVVRNPFGGRLTDIAAVRTEDMVFLTPQEFTVVLRHVREEYRPLIRLLAGTGLRFGEATALTVRDVELLARRKTLTVTKAWKRTDSSTWVIGEPKTRRSRRTLSLSPELVETLTPLWAGRRGDELLFPGAGGGRLPHIEVYKRGWAPAVARAQVCDAHYGPQLNKRGKPKLLPDPCDCAGTIDKAPRIHDLRHSHASWLIADGVHSAAISRRLGHSSITITVDRYGHLDPALDDQIDAAVDRALTGSRLSQDLLDERDQGAPLPHGERGPQDG